MTMKLEDYHKIEFFFPLVPPIIINVVIFLFVFYTSNEKRFVAFVLNGVVTRRAFKQQPKLFICGKEIVFHGTGHSRSKSSWCVLCFFIIQACFHLLLLLSTVERSYECLNDPNLDCFMEKDSPGFNETLHRDYEDYPVNCSRITSSQIVFCYRIVAFQPNAFFLALSATYLFLKILKASLVGVSKLLLWLVNKFSLRTVNIIRGVVYFLVFLILFLLSILRQKVQKFESAVRKISPLVYVLMVIVLIIATLFLVLFPLNEFENSPQYLIEVSQVKHCDPERVEKKNENEIEIES